MEKIIKTKQTYTLILWAVAGFAFALLFPIVFSFLHIRISYFKPLVFLIACILFYYSTFRQKKYENPISYIMLGMIFFLIAYFIYELVLTYLHIPQWDFISFYLFGHVGILHADFYDPRVFMQVFNDLNLPGRVNEDFIPEIVNVGFWYPPPSMFLFLPLGLFSLKTAYFIWQSIMIAFLIIDIFLLIQYFKIRLSPIYDKRIMVFFSILLILLFPGLTAAITYSQTVSVFLFFLILLLKYIDNWKAGVCLAILIVIKPLAIVFLLYFILYKKWKVIQSFFFTGIGILLVSLVFFGYHSFLNYFISAPTSRIPTNLFYENTIQSLNGVVLRLQQKLFGYINFKSARAVVISLSILITLVTLYASKMLSRKPGILSFIIFVPMTLLVYPNTQDFYILLMLPCVLYLLVIKLFRYNLFNIALFFLLFLIGYYSLFIFDLVVWIVLVLSSLPPRFVAAIPFYNFIRTVTEKLKTRETILFT